MPSPIVRSVSLRLRGPKNTRELRPIAKHEGNVHALRRIGVPSVTLRFNAALTEPTGRLARGGEGLSDINPFPARLTSVKLQSRVTTPNVARRGGVISENQDDNRATTTVVMVTGPRVDALEVTAQWIKG